MSPIQLPDLPRRAIVAVVLLLICVLLAQAWLATALEGSGHGSAHAINLARLVTLPVLVALAWLVVRPCRRHFANLLDPATLSPTLAFRAMAIGLLARVTAWAELTFRGAVGWVPGARDAPPREFLLGFGCPVAEVIAAAAVVWLILVPVSEEFIHRGIIQGRLQRYGTWPAIIVSSVIFAAMHEPSSYVWVFLMGLLLGVQFRLAGSLWPPLITHATYDGLNLLDKVCTRLAWNPAPDTLPRWGTALVSAILVVLSAALILRLLRGYPAETP